MSLSRDEKIEKLHLKRGLSRCSRWLICQKIGEAFFNSQLTDERLQEIRDYFAKSDFLKEEIFKPKLK